MFCKIVSIRKGYRFFFRFATIFQISADVKKSIILNEIFEKLFLHDYEDWALIMVPLCSVSDPYQEKQFFKIKKLLMGGHDEKLKNFGKSKK